MMTQHFPALDDSSIAVTRDALHAYARVLGDWLKRCRSKRKHWWHASLRCSLNGLTTGVVHAGIDFELELNLRESLLHGRTATGAFQEIDLAAAFAPVARFSQTVLHTSKHAELMTLACKNALVERDVAHLIFPDDVQTLPAADSATASRPEGRLATSAIAPAEDVLEDAISLIKKSKRPIVIVGYGARDA